MLDPLVIDMVKAVGGGMIEDVGVDNLVRLGGPDVLFTVLVESGARYSDPFTKSLFNNLRANEAEAKQMLAGMMGMM